MIGVSGSVLIVFSRLLMMALDVWKEVKYYSFLYCILLYTGIGFHCRINLVRIDGTMNSQHNISEVLEPVVHLYIQRLPSAIPQQDNMRPHVARSVQAFFFTHQIELLPWPDCSPDLSRLNHTCTTFESYLHND
ncbi:transposable element Tcb1 transposase [Trichonephila clavipes]|nr:transposable element Tcb1 transposase [Trichonephila clavipes]